MKYEWIDDYVLAKAAVQKDLKVEWRTTNYLLKGKIFCMIGGDKYGDPIVSLKCDPFLAERFREEYEAIVPGYHLNKTHWNSVYFSGNVPDEVMKKMIDMSYELVFKSLTKKLQKEIAGTQSE